MTSARIRVLLLGVFFGLASMSQGAVNKEAKSIIDDIELVSTLIKGFRLTVWPNHVYNDTTVRFRIESSFSQKIAVRLAEQSETTNTSAGFRWRLDIVEVDSQAHVARTLTFPITAEKSVAAINPMSLPEGLYRVEAYLLAPDGAARRVWYEPKPPRKRHTADRFLAIYRGPVPTLETRFIDDPNLLTQLELLGNPGRHQFPDDSAGNCHGRSVWDLQLDFCIPNSPI